MTRKILASSGLLFRPFLVSSVVALVWRFVFFPFGFHVGKADETSVTNSNIPGLVTFHAILAAMVIAKVWDEFKETRRCRRNNDKKAFQECLQDRIPGVVHLLLGVVSAFLIFATMVVEYTNPWAGIHVIVSNTFILALYWEVATRLDNPRKAPWYEDEIPDDWWPADKIQGGCDAPTAAAVPAKET